MQSIRAKLRLRVYAQDNNTRLSYRKCAQKAIILLLERCDEKNRYCSPT